MDRQQILNGYAKLRKQIEQEKEKSFEKIVRYVNRNFNSQSQEEFVNHIFDLILNSLEKTYSLTAAAAKEIYNIQDNNIEDIDINKLTYSQDGQSLIDRLNKHYIRTKEKQQQFKLELIGLEKVDEGDLDKHDVVVGENAILLYLDGCYYRVLNTESSYLSNQVLYQKIKKLAHHAEICGIGECTEKDGSPCEEWIRMGKMPIEDLVELPPYHPNCECEVIYYID